MVHGIDADLQRQNHPADEIIAKKSSFDYSGRISEKYHKCGCDYVIIDSAVQIRIANPARRQEIQSILSQHERNANITAMGGLAGIGCSVYKFLNGDYLSGGLTLLAGVGVTGWGMGRAEQAKSMRIKWDDPTPQVCEARSAASISFQSLMSQNLKKSHFTVDETQHIFHKIMSQFGSDYAIRASENNPKKMQSWVLRFSNENPMQPHALKYAFEDQRVIQDPGNPTSGHWDRKVFDRLATRSVVLSTELTAFQAETELQLLAIQNRQKLGHTVIGSTDLLAKTLMDQNANTENREKQKTTVNRVALLANVSTDVYASTQRATLFADRRSEFMKKFPQQVGEILDEYRSARRMGHKK